MRHLVEAVRQATATRNFEAALFLALALPDICAGLQADDGKSNGQKYMAWFDRFLADVYSLPARPVGVHGIEPATVFLSASDCYALRCALLHEGSVEISGQRAQQVLDSFQFTVVRNPTWTVHRNGTPSVLQLDVRIFCEEMCVAVEQWMTAFAQEHPDKTWRLGKLVRVHVLG